MTYRPDVDGLRAIAILFVLLFHSGLKLFSLWVYWCRPFFRDFWFFNY